MARVSANSLVERFLALFQEELSEAIDDSDLDLEGALISSQIIDFNALTEIEIGALDRLQLRSVLSLTMPDLITFNPKKLQLWARDALRFFDANWDHSDFRELFGSGLNYAVITLDAANYGVSTTKLQKTLEDLTKIDLKNRISAYFTVDFREALTRFAKIAASKAINLLAIELVEEASNRKPRRSRTVPEIQAIKRDPSFLTERGAIPFTIEKNKLEIGNSETPSAQTYLSAVQRSIARIRDRGIMERIHNRDPEIAGLFSEYENELNIEQKDGYAVKIWFIGNEMENRVRASHTGTTSEDALDTNSLVFITAFLTAHNLYLQSFPEIEKLTLDLDRTANLYKNLDQINRSNTWSILTRLSDNEDLFAARTLEVLKTASSAVEAKEHPTKGLIAICLGLVRGSLKAMAATVLSSCLAIISDTVSDTFSEIFQKVLEQEGLEKSSINFFVSNTQAVTQLAQSMPSYFLWIRSFLNFLGIS